MKFQFFSDAPLLVGFETTPASIKIATLKFQKGKFHIHELKEFSHSEHETVNPLYNDIAQLSKNSVLATAIDGKDVLIRQIDMPLVKEKDILSALEFQIEPLLPYPIENALIQHYRTRSSETQTFLTIFSTKKERLEAHLQLMHPFVNPEVVTCVPMALAALFYHFFFTAEPTLVTYSNNVQTTTILVDEGKLLASRTFDHQDPSVDPKAFSKELCKSILSIEAAFKHRQINNLLLIGTPFCKQGTVDHIQKIISKHCSVPYIPSLSEEKFAQYAMAIGVALSAHQPLINFRQNEFTYPHPWKREKKHLTIFFGLALLLSLSAFLLTRAHSEYQLETLHHQYIELLAIEGKPLNETLHMEKLSLEDLKDRVDQLENEIKARPEHYALLPGVPKVSDILAWISTHPQIAASLISQESPIKIEGFNYIMTKRPDAQRKNEHYQVKIDLEFTANHPSVARALHDALLAPNPIVDPKYEVQWSSSKNRYKASFYAKDKTRYG